MSAIADQMHREYEEFIDDAYIHGSTDWIGYADQESTLQKIWEACQCHDLAERMARINQVLADEIAACAQRHVDNQVLADEIAACAQRHVDFLMKGAA